MAERPLFIPIRSKGSVGVERSDIEFKWFPGLSVSQKQKSITSLHESAKDKGCSNVLEISSKSLDPLGIKLSAFNLMIQTQKKNRKFSIETAFQSSKVFEHGGPFIDLLTGTSKQAKQDQRLKESGRLIGFEFFGQLFSLEPRTFFYDWLYINALHRNVDLSSEVLKFDAFTDIEFNPKKSINCQAYSAALYCSICFNGLINKATESKESFLEIIESFNKVHETKSEEQIDLF